jgi:Helix-turn-helix domain
MSLRELERVEVMGRVAHKELKLTDAAAMLELSYRQAKRLWRRYQRKGRKGLQHGNCGSSLQSQQARQSSSPSAALDQAEIFRFGRGGYEAFVYHIFQGATRRAGCTDLTQDDRFGTWSYYSTAISHSLCSPSSCCQELLNIQAQLHLTF